MSIDEILFLDGTTPAKGAYRFLILGDLYAGCRSMSYPDHKSDGKVLVSAGGTEAIAHTSGVLNPDAEGNFKLLPASADILRIKLQVLAGPLGSIKDVIFDVEAFAVDPRTQIKINRHQSIGCKITGMKDDDVGDGSEEVGCVFSYKSLREKFDGFSIT